MADVKLIEFADGRKLLLGGEVGSGREQVSTGRAAKISADRFAEALGTLGDVVDLLEKKLGGLPSRPNKVELEFGASLSGDANLWIVSGEAKAEFKVKLTWETKPATPPAPKP